LNKRALMLSAAIAVVMSAPAFAAAPIDSVATTAQKTSALPNPLNITSTGGIKLSSGSVPLLTVDSNSVITNAGTFTFQNTASAVAILIDGTKNTVGSLTESGTIDLTGSGITKSALHLSGAGSYTGPITFSSSSVVKIAGDSSNGIVQDSGFLLNGDLLLGGTFTMTPTQTNGTAASGIALANLQGTIKGNVSITTGATYTAVGNNAAGFLISGPILPCDQTITSGCNELGTFSNSGTINIVGVATRSSKTANAESGSAVVIGNSVMGGILNNGPTSSSDTVAAAIIQANGVNSATFVIAPATNATNITIGLDTADADGATNSFINRGNIMATPEDANANAHDIQITGASSQTITFLGGFFNSGLINAQATSITPGNAVSATALEIDSFVTIPEIEVSGQSASGANTNGVISASINGTNGGIATAILIAGQPVNGANVTSVPNITIDTGGRVLAAANTTDPTNKAVTQLVAIAIEDRSNSLVTLNNAGTISATATPLTNGFTSVAHAVDTSFNSVGLNFMNTGTVVGDVLLGSGADTYTIQGTGPDQIATHTGDINFGTSIGGTNIDTLNVNTFANVSGAITAQGALDVNVLTNATLTVKNLPTRVQDSMLVQNLIVAGGTQSSAGTLNITVSSGLAAIPLIKASQSVTFGTGANLGIQFGGFIPSDGTFLLLSAPHGALNIDPNDVARYTATLSGNGLPFLFKSAVVKTDVTGAGGVDLLELVVATRSATELGLTGYAAKLFPTVNVAISGDDALGAAMVAGINSAKDAEAAYNAFAPDVSGGTRAVALSLTDQATGVVAARERQLRMFAKSPGELTLWGNEFGEYQSTHGQTKTGVPGETLPVDFQCTGKCPEISLSGFKDHGFGFSLGLDGGAPDAGWYGAAFTFYTGDVQAGPTGAAPNSKTGELWYLLTGYTDWRGKGLFLDTQVSVGYGQLKGKRFLTLTIPVTNGFTTFTREADNTHAALVGSLGATAGAVMKYGSTTVTPQISLDGMTLRQEGFTEANGGNGFNLRVRSSYANSMRVFLGTEARQDVDVGDFVLQPSARVGYRFDLLNGAEKVRAQFADIDSNTSGLQSGDIFTIKGPDPSRGNFVGGLNLNATTDNWTIGLSYDFVRGDNNATEQTGVISLLGRI
jgi:hypothetical protein